MAAGESPTATTTTIYALKDPATGEIRYVGKANDLEARLRSHRWEKRNPKLRTRKVHWLRTLTADPIVEVLEVCPREIWAGRERHWIKKYRDEGARLTNIADGGQTSPVEGRGHSEETKAKLRAASLKRGATPPSRAGATPWNKGIKGIGQPNDGSFQKGCAAWNKGQKRTRCKRDHELNLETAYYKDGRFRYCKKCQSEHVKAYVARQRAT